jgi:hypothetical protein
LQAGLLLQDDVPVMCFTREHGRKVGHFEALPKIQVPVAHSPGTTPSSAATTSPLLPHILGGMAPKWVDICDPIPLLQDDPICPPHAVLTEDFTDRVYYHALKSGLLYVACKSPGVNKLGPACYLRCVGHGEPSDSRELISCTWRGRAQVIDQRLHVREAQNTPTHKSSKHTNGEDFRAASVS